MRKIGRFMRLTLASDDKNSLVSLLSCNSANENSPTASRLHCASPFADAGPPLLTVAGVDANSSGQSRN